MVFVEKLRRPTALAAAALLLVASAIPLLVYGTASAYSLLGDREIRMSSSEAAATGVTYRVDFDVSTNDDVGGIVVAFCEGSPIIGESTCDVPAGFSLDSATAAEVTADSDVDMSGFTSATSNEATSGTADNTLTFSSATAVSAAEGDAAVFEISDVVNPNATGTFYARIMVYDSETDAQAYTLGNVDPVQAGGIALSTAELITIEAKVQERITFCVFANPGTLTYDEDDCSAVVDPVILGNEDGVLDPGMPSISSDAMFNITTNASTGATVRMKGDTLQSGSFLIDAIGDATPGDGTAVASDPGVEQFGLCVWHDTNSEAGLTPEAPYADGACEGATTGQSANQDNGALFAFDSAGIGSLYGDPIAEKTAGEWSTGVLVFLGNISNTTEPGIYTTTLDFIATGRY